MELICVLINFNQQRGSVISLDFICMSGPLVFNPLNQSLQCVHTSAGRDKDSRAILLVYQALQESS